MYEVDQRAALERLVRERREDYAGLSRLLGRNSAYIQQFIKRGIPRRLSEGDRGTLARYFQVDESVLGGPRGSNSGEHANGLVSLPRLDVDASAGPGAVGGEESVIANVSFDRAWLRRFCASSPRDLSIIRVQGDSMAPTLTDGDEILVDCSDSANRLRDGIYVLRPAESLMVKRIAVNPISRSITIKSDNPAYPVWPECRPEDVKVIGRVLWAGRKVA